MKTIGRNQTGARLACLLPLLAALFLWGCVPIATVVQGTVVSADPAAQTITVRDEKNPEAPPVVLNIAGAEMAAAPVEGDVVRVAYFTKDGANRAVRLMNLTRQQELDKGGGH